MTGAIDRTPLAALSLRAHAAALHSPAAVRVLTAASLPRVAWRRGHAPQAIARALKTIALDRVPAQECEWTARIEAHRDALNKADEEAQPFEKTLPQSVGSASWNVSIPPPWTRFLMRLVRELQPHSCLELGTGLGISTAYQAAALELNDAGRMVTLDGSHEWSEIAREGLESLGLDRVSLAVGPIEETLAGVLEEAAPVDYALVDAEHTEEATVRYFASLLPYLSDGAVVLFDDIPWSRELRRAWRRIAREPGVWGFALGRMGVAVVSRSPS